MGNERDDKGRFLPGHEPSSPGRPRTEAAEKLKAALEDVIGNGTLPKWKAAMKKRLEKGDQWATEFAFDRLAGKVKSSVEVSGPDGAPVVLELVTRVVRSKDDEIADETTD